MQLSRRTRIKPRPRVLEPRLLFDGAALIDLVALPERSTWTPPPLERTAPPMEAPATPEPLRAMAPDVRAPLANLTPEALDLAQHATWAAQQTLRELLASSENTRFASLFFSEPMNGDQWQRWQALRQAILGGEFQVEVQVLDGEIMRSALGAFAAKGPEGQAVIFLNRSWLAQRPDSEAIQRVILEEFGHAIDEWLHPGVDTHGDEGERFALQALGVTPDDVQLARIAADDDHADLLIDGQVISVEMAEISVPFTEGAIGTQGANTGIANSIKTLSTLGISKAMVFQDSNNGSFGGTQGNDYAVGVRLFFADGSVKTINAAVNWRISSGNTNLMIGVIPDAATNLTFAYSGGNFTIGPTSNMVFELIGANYSYSDGDNLSGNAATAQAMDALNAYLTTVRANDPNGPVTVTSLTTTDTTPTLSGTATLQAGETLSVLVNGVTYTSANGLVASGGNWSLTVPNADALAPGTYSVTATITNSSGYTLSDSSVNELVIEATDTTAPSVTGPSGGAGAATSTKSVAEGTTAVHTFTANESVTWSLNGGTDAGRFQIDASTGALTFIAAPDYEAPNDSDTNNTYVVTVKATDAAGNVSNQTLTVTVTDVAEGGPSITGPSGGAGAATSTASVAENTTAVHTFTANSAVTWSLNGGTDAARFQIDANTGALRFVTAPDYEAPSDANTNNTYEVIVQATDGQGNITSQTLTVSVTDVAEATTQLTVSSPTVNEASPYAVFSLTFSQALTQPAAILPTLSSGSATLGLDALNRLEYFDGSTWQAVTNAGITYAAGSLGGLLRMPVLPDTLPEVSESLTLTATVLSGLSAGPAQGVLTIRDDGQGGIYLPTSTSATPLDPQSPGYTGPPVDDDRWLSISSPQVNEASPYAVFTITGSPDRPITLSVDNSDPDSVDLGTSPPLEILTPTGWVPYVPGSTVSIPPGGELLARVAIGAEVEPGQDGPESLELVVTPQSGSPVSGVATIQDDGTGGIYPANSTSPTPIDPYSPTYSGPLPKNDRPPTTQTPVQILDVTEGPQDPTPDDLLTLDKTLELTFSAEPNVDSIVLYRRDPNTQVWNPVPSADLFTIDRSRAPEGIYRLIFKENGLPPGEYGLSAIKNGVETAVSNSFIYDSIPGLFDRTELRQVVTDATQQVHIDGSLGGLDQTRKPLYWNQTNWIDSDGQIVRFSFSESAHASLSPSATNRDAYTFGAPPAGAFVTATLANGSTLSLNTQSGAYAYTPDAEATLDVFVLRASDGLQGSQLILTFDARDPLDRDGITSQLERLAAQLATPGSTVAGDFNQDGIPDANQNAVTTFVWTQAGVFTQAVLDPTAFTQDAANLNTIVSLNVQGDATGSEIDSSAQIYGVSVIDPLQDGGVVGGTNADNAVWDPLQFSIEPLQSLGLLDVDPTRAGTQVRVVIDLRSAGIAEGEMTGYMKYVSQKALDAYQALGRNLVDLDGQVIQKAGWYDFTRRGAEGDGARMVVEGGKVVAIELVFTDNAFGDNNPNSNRIEDPGVPVVTRATAPTPVRQNAVPLNTEERSPPAASPPSFTAFDGLGSSASPWPSALSWRVDSAVDPLTRALQSPSPSPWPTGMGLAATGDGWAGSRASADGDSREHHAPTDGPRQDDLFSLRGLEESLLVQRKMPDQFTVQEGSGRFGVPADVFRHSRPDARILLSAKQLDGQALPSWILFNAQTGVFSFQAPAGFRGELELLLTARDDAGRSASTPFKFRVADEVSMRWRKL